MKKTTSNSFKKNEDTRIWCEYCRIYVYNNRINRDKHDSSPRHQENFKKKVETLRKDEERASKVQKNESTSVKFEKSFYQTGFNGNLSHNEANIQPKNILSLKTSTGKSVEKKTMLGLASNTVGSNYYQVPSLLQIEKDSNLLLHKKDFNLNSVNSDLKRKAKEDEKLLFEQNQSADSDKNEDPNTVLESLNMFKKHKTK